MSKTSNRSESATAPEPPMPEWMGRRRQPVSREFLADHPLVETVREGQRGYLVKVRLTSYRTLPLSCIERISLRIGDREIDSSSCILKLGIDEYRLTEIAALGSRYWFILDFADIYFPSERELLGASPVDVEGTMVTVEPYMTAGRFSFTNTSRRSLHVVKSDFYQG